MTEEEFRINHSKIIEYYQYIEMRLKGICAKLNEDDGRSWYALLMDYDLDPLGRLLKQIRELQNIRSVVLFPEDDLEALDEIRIARNYWVHQCFGGTMPVTFKRGVVKNTNYSERIIADLKTAIEWDEKITKVSCSIPI